MTFITRALRSMVLMALVTFCMFGFVDTFEPMPRLQQLAWRVVYGFTGVAALSSILWMWLRPRRIG